mgnify:FL=1
MKLGVIALSPAAQVRLNMRRFVLTFDPGVRLATLVVVLAALDLMVECRYGQLWIVPITEPYRRRVESLIARISHVR